MEYIVIAVVAVAVFYLVSYPLFGRQRRRYDIETAFELGDVRQLNHLNVTKTRIEENLRELEFEHQMGKLSEKDYTALRDGYTKEIDDVTNSLDAFKARREIEGLIEDEIRARRRTK